MYMEEQQILESKILIPDLPKDYERREKLLSKMQHIEENLLVLCAPSGYGKTVLMSQYARLSGYSCAWYHLDFSDNEFVIFVRYLTLSFSKALGGFRMEENMCPDTDTEKDSQLGRKLIMKLKNCIKDMKEQKLVLVLDEFQVLEKPKIFQFLKELLDHMDHHFMLAVLTKDNLSESFAKYFIHHKSSIMGGRCLSLEESEVNNILERMISKESGKKYAKIIWEDTKGWPAGVMLAARCLSRVCDGTFRVKWEQLSRESCIENYITYELFRSFLNNRSGEELKRQINKEIAAFYQTLGEDVKEEEYAAIVPKRADEKKKSFLSVSCFGKFRVVLTESGREIPWRTRKAMEFFAYLVDLEGKPVERRELLECLWPDNAPNNEVAMLHNMIYNIRKELSAQPELADLIQYKKHQYRLDMSRIKVDLDIKKKICALAEAGKGKEIYEHREELLHNWGVYLKEVDGTWCIARRTYFERTYGKACTVLADYCREKGDYETEVSCWSAYMAADRYSEKAVAGLMRCYAKMGERNQLQQIYQYAKKIFREEMETELSPETVQIYKEGLKRKKE
ncbi:MAG: AAA family ATPase [Lachnospiraceae bacterium]|nr:AAA family ATPase [Lachnospiraceae bacterium]